MADNSALLKNGNKILIDNDPYLVIENDFVNPGKGQAFTRVKIRNLLNNKVVGLVRGNMEFGPRALCNRSIIYKTSDITCNDWLNKRMNRTEFMPFAPVITSENAKIYFKKFDEKDRTLWFMTATVEVSKTFKKLCPAVTHVDGTARPQVASCLHLLRRPFALYSLSARKPRPPPSKHLVPSLREEDFLVLLYTCSLPTQRLYGDLAV